MKILVSDALGQGGMDILHKEKNLQVDEKVGLKPEELKKIIGEYDAILIRSATKLTADIIEAGKKLRVIGRAGVGPRLGDHCIGCGGLRVPVRPRWIRHAWLSPPGRAP